MAKFIPVLKSQLPLLVLPPPELLVVAVAAVVVVAVFSLRLCLPYLRLLLLSLLVLPPFPLAKLLPPLTPPSVLFIPWPLLLALEPLLALASSPPASWLQSLLLVEATCPESPRYSLPSPCPSTLPTVTRAPIPATLPHRDDQRGAPRRGRPATPPPSRHSPCATLRATLSTRQAVFCTAVRARNTSRSYPAASASFSSLTCGAR